MDNFNSIINSSNRTGKWYINYKTLYELIYHFEFTINSKNDKRWSNMTIVYNNKSFKIHELDEQMLRCPTQSDVKWSIGEYGLKSIAIWFMKCKQSCFNNILNMGRYNVKDPTIVTWKEMTKYDTTLSIFKATDVFVDMDSVSGNYIIVDMNWEDVKFTSRINDGLKPIGNVKEVKDFVFGDFLIYEVMHSETNIYSNSDTRIYVTKIEG